MKKILMTVVAMASACAVTVEARTLVWYHFNEGAVGETTTSPGEKTIVNAAETGSVYDGRVWTCPANGSTSNRAMSATSEYVGTYSEGFPSGVRVIDPQTGAAFTNERSLYLAAARHDGYGKFVMITIDDAAELHVSNITVEAFVKFDETDTSGTWRTIAMKQTDATNGRCSWGLRAGGGGGLMSQTDGRKADGTFELTQANVNTPSLFDGKWHHVAMVVDGDAMKQSIYLDYRLLTSATLLHPIDYTGDDPIVIGNTVYANYGCLGGGWIDEFRISDAALHPSQFIRFRTRPDEMVDDDTVVYLTFDAHSWFGGTYLHNESWGPVSTNATLHINTGTATLEMDGMPGEGTIRNGIFGDEISNLGAFHFKTNATEKKSALIAVDDESRMMTTSNFTFEAFWRWTEKHSSGNIYPFGEHGQKGQAIIAVMNASGSLSVSVQAWAESNIVDATTGEIMGTDPYAVVKTLAKNYAGLVDDKWHHLALVRDFDAMTVKFYIDYNLVGSVNDVTNLYVLPVSGALGGNKYNNNFLIGGAYGTGSAYQTNNGYLDEIRFTKRALTRQEFLMRDPHPDFSTNTLAWFTFEEDYMPEPRAESRTPTVGTCSLDADVPGGRHTIIADGYGNELRHSNTRSLKLTKGKTALTLPRDLPLENHEEVTVEFFAKGTAANRYATVVTFGGTRKGYEDAATDKNNATIWAIQTAYTNRLYRAHVVSTKTGSNGTATTGESEEDVTIDGKWHHVAATFGKNASANKTPVNIYYDYKLVGQGNVSGFLRTNLVDSVLTVGGGIAGYIDEIRISKGVLPVEAFLRRQTQGLVVIIK